MRCQEDPVTHAKLAAAGLGLLLFLPVSAQAKDTHEKKERFDYTLYVHDQAGSLLSVRPHGEAEGCVIDRRSKPGQLHCGDEVSALLNGDAVMNTAQALRFTADEASEEINLGTRNWGMRILSSEDGATDRANVEIRRGKTRMNILALDGEEGDIAVIETINASAKEVVKVIEDLEDVDNQTKEAMLSRLNLAD
jgi:hypothetical protein